MKHVAFFAFLFLAFTTNTKAQGKISDWLPLKSDGKVSVAYKVSSCGSFDKVLLNITNSQEKSALVAWSIKFRQKGSSDWQTLDGEAVVGANQSKAGVCEAVFGVRNLSAELSSKGEVEVQVVRFSVSK